MNFESNFNDFSVGELLDFMESGEDKAKQFLETGYTFEELLNYFSKISQNTSIKIIEGMFLLGFDHVIYNNYYGGQRFMDDAKESVIVLKKWKKHASSMIEFKNEFKMYAIYNMDKNDDLIISRFANKFA